MQLAAGRSWAVARSHFPRRPWHDITASLMKEKIIVVVTTVHQIKPVLLKSIDLAYVDEYLDKVAERTWWF